jgi:hypothetical protein
LLVSFSFEWRNEYLLLKMSTKLSLIPGKPSRWNSLIIENSFIDGRFEIAKIGEEKSIFSHS